MENSLEFPQNFVLLYDLAVPLLGIYPKEIKSLLGKKHLHSCVHYVNNQL